MQSNWDLRSVVLKRIIKRGGWVNTHTHLDRAYTIRMSSLRYANATLREKWDLVDEVKRKSSVHDIYDRMSFAIEYQIKNGVKTLASFIDVDDVVKDKSMIAADKVRRSFLGDIRILYINQALKGVLSKKSQYWFNEALNFVDIIGGLPKKDAGREEEHIDFLFSEAVRTKKMVHVHVDQNNDPKEKEIEMLIKKTREHKLQGKVVAIHGVSLAAKSKGYREKIYNSMKKEDVMLITCPTAWIDARRTEILTVFHNAVAPVEEMIPQGITVGLGTDNIADIYKPFTNGDMWTELRFLLESCHYYDVDQLVNIATVNGKKVLGI